MAQPRPQPSKGHVWEAVPTDHPGSRFACLSCRRMVVIADGTCGPLEEGQSYTSRRVHIVRRIPGTDDGAILSRVPFADCNTCIATDVIES